MQSGMVIDSIEVDPMQCWDYGVAAMRMTSLSCMRACCHVSQPR